MHVSVAATIPASVSASITGYVSTFLVVPARIPCLYLCCVPYHSFYLCHCLCHAACPCFYYSLCVCLYPLSPIPCPVSTVSYSLLMLKKKKSFSHLSSLIKIKIDKMLLGSFRAIGRELSTVLTESSSLTFSPSKFISFTLTPAVFTPSAPFSTETTNNCVLLSQSNSCSCIFRL